MAPTILLAEDDPLLTATCQQYLTLCGYHVLITLSGPDCMSILRHTAPAVIVVSLELPWDAAGDLAESLREISRWHRDPSVILTGHTSDADVGPLHQEPCVFSYLRKPFELGRLLDCIRSIESDCRASRGLS